MILICCFNPMFDEYFKHSQSAVSTTVFATTLPPQDTCDDTSSIIIDQDAPSPSTTPTTRTTTTLIQSTNVEELNNEDNDAEFDNDTFTNLFYPPVTNSNESSSSRIVDTSNMHTQFCDSNLEVAFIKHTYFVRNLEGIDLLSGSRACQKGKIKKESHKPKPKPSASEKLQMLYMDLYGQMRVESINKKRCILIIIDDYSRFTWVKFLRTKDETLKVIIKFLKQAQVSLQATIRYLRTDNETQFVNHTLRSYIEDVGITRETSVESYQTRILQHQLNLPQRMIWICCFNPMFDEYFKHSQSAVSTTVSATTLPPQDTCDDSSSIIIDQDAPSPSTTPTTRTTTLIQSTNVKELNNEDNDAEFDNDTFTNLFDPPVTNSNESSSSRIVDTSNMHTFQQTHSHIRR
nr:putative ribonuclease H-like domain-containing protein [Tanacetum cinerariifolium]